MPRHVFPDKANRWTRAPVRELGLDGWYLEDGRLLRKYNTDGGREPRPSETGG